MTNEQSQVPGVTDKRIAPPGGLPNNAQTMVLGGLAAVMVIVIWFSGRSSPKSRASTTSTAEPAIQPPSQDKIVDYSKQIEAEARKLKQEQDDLAREKGLLDRAIKQNRVAPGSGQLYQYSSAAGASNLQSPQNSEASSWVAQEKVKREYTSRFASNIAGSLRSDQKPANAEAPTPPVQASPAIDPRLYPWPPMLPPGTPVSQTPAENAGETTKSNEQTAHTAKLILPDLNRSTGKDYRLFEGTVIESVLTNRLDGTFSGPVNCLISYNLYSHDHNHILIPAGSRVLGDVHPVDSSGQSRLAVTFHRLVMPDGFTVNLDQFRGLDQVGETGLRDQVNHHYLQIFGASIAIGMIAGLAQSNTQYGLSTSATDAYRQGVANSLSQSSMHALDRFLNILPTFTIREGQRIKIYLQQDLALPSYENHQMSPDI